MKGLAVLAKTFEQIDVNGSGTLDFQEFVNGIADQNLDATEDEVVALFKTLDKDGNGVVDYDEFVQTMRGRLTGVRL
jgi:Ca2+-binding EF-hand superfamily protein